MLFRSPTHAHTPTHTLSHTFERIRVLKSRFMPHYNLPRLLVNLESLKYFLLSVSVTPLPEVYFLTSLTTRVMHKNMSFACSNQHLNQIFLFSYKTLAQPCLHCIHHYVPISVLKYLTIRHNSILRQPFKRSYLLLQRRAAGGC